MTFIHLLFLLLATLGIFSVSMWILEIIYLREIKNPYGHKKKIDRIVKEEEVEPGED